MALTKYDIVDRIKRSLGFDKQQSKNAVEDLIEIIKFSLESREDVMVSGFGKFQVREKQERLGRNPKTGEKMILDPRKVVRFKYSRKLKAKLNEEK